MDKVKVEKRAWKKIETIPECGCWIWVGATKKRGYGSFGVHGASFGAHRVIYSLYRGPIPDGFQLDHLCRVRCCVNPDHLEPVTSHENSMRGENRIFKALQSPYCKNGHKYDDRNTRYQSLPGGYTGRVCRDCDKDAARIRRKTQDKTKTKASKRLHYLKHREEILMKRAAYVNNKKHAFALAVQQLGEPT